MLSNGGTAVVIGNQVSVDTVVNGYLTTVTGSRNCDGTVTIPLPQVFYNTGGSTASRRNDSWRSNKANRSGAGWRETHGRLR